jgi:hypothetical protein
VSLDKLAREKIDDERPTFTLDGSSRADQTL